MKPTNFSQKSAGATKEMTTAVVPARPQAVESATSAGQRSAAAASTQQPGGEGALLPGAEGSPEQLQRVGFWSGGVSRVGRCEPGPFEPCRGATEQTEELVDVGEEEGRSQ